MNVRWKRDWRWAAVALLALLAVGCGKTDGSNEKTGDADNGPKKGVEKDAKWKGGLNVVDGTWDDLQQLIESHKGKVVVVDFWARWCDPCVEELPHLAELQNRFGDEIVCIALALENEGTKKFVLEDARKNAEETVRKRFSTVLDTDKPLHANFRLFVSRTPDEYIYQMAKIDSVPTILVYDKSGGRTQFDVNYAKEHEDKDLSYQKHVIPVVEKLIRE